MHPKNSFKRRISDIVAIIVLSAFILMAFTSCNRSFYSKISPANFLVGDWYQFEGFRYRGSLINGMPNGSGTVEYDNGTKVSGKFANGVLNDSKAIYYIPNIGYIEGVAISGKLVSGQIRYSNGDLYVGKINAYSPSGDGVLIRSNKDVFQGKFQDGKLLMGVFLDGKSNNTFQGSFKNWKPEGDVVEIKPDGQAIPHIYSNGTDRTSSTLATRAANIVKNRNDAEINEIDAKNNRLAKQVQAQTSDFQEKKAKMDEEGGEMYNRCACTLNLKLCLTVTNAGVNNTYAYSAYYKELGLPEPYGQIYSRVKLVELPYGSSKAAIKQAFLNQIEFVSECVKWNADRDNYERNHKEKMANLLASHQQFVERVELEINENKKQKQLVYQRQENEKQMRYEAEISKMKKDMEARAQKIAQQRKEQCNKNPDCCLSASNIENLKNSKTYSPCAVAQ